MMEAFLVNEYGNDPSQIFANKVKDHFLVMVALAFFHVIIFSELSVIVDGAKAGLVQRSTHQFYAPL